MTSDNFRLPRSSSSTSGPPMGRGARASVRPPWHRSRLRMVHQPGHRTPIVGLYLSFWLDAASGATIVLVETAIFLVALLVGPRSGLFRAKAGRSG